jgi:hypothetical protein
VGSPAACRAHSHSTSSPSATDGTRYTPGETVRVDHSSGQVQIVKDPEGDYEVMGCRKATEYGGDPPLLRVDLRKREAPPARDPDPWAR